MNKTDVLEDKQQLLNDTRELISKNYPKINEKNKEALVLQTALTHLDRQHETIAGLRYSLVYDAFRKCVFSPEFETIEEWLDSFGMNPRQDGYFGQIFRIATQLTIFCENENVLVNRVPVNHDWFIDFTNGKCRVNRTRHLISKAMKIIETTSKSIDQRADEITQLLEWVDDPNLTNEDLRDKAREDGESGEDDGYIGIVAMVVENGGSFEITINATDDQYLHLKRKLSRDVEFREIQQKSFS